MRGQDAKNKKPEEYSHPNSVKYFTTKWVKLLDNTKYSAESKSDQNG